MVDAGLKSEYSDVKGNDHLVALIVGAIGMAYVPLESHNVVGNNSIKDDFSYNKRLPMSPIIDMNKNVIRCFSQR